MILSGGSGSTSLTMSNWDGSYGWEDGNTWTPTVTGPVFIELFPPGGIQYFDGGTYVGIYDVVETSSGIYLATYNTQQGYHRVTFNAVAGEEVTFSVDGYVNPLAISWGPATEATIDWDDFAEVPDADDETALQGSTDWAGRRSRYGETRIEADYGTWDAGFDCLNTKVLGNHDWSQGQADHYVAYGDPLADNPTAAACEGGTGDSTTDVLIAGISSAGVGMEALVRYDQGGTGNRPTVALVFRAASASEAALEGGAMLLVVPREEAFTDLDLPSYMLDDLLDHRPFEWLDGIDHRVVDSFLLTMTGVTYTANPNGIESTAVNIYPTSFGSLVSDDGTGVLSYDSLATPGDLGTVAATIVTPTTDGVSFSVDIDLDYSWFPDTAPDGWDDRFGTPDARYGVFLVDTAQHAEARIFTVLPPTSGTTRAGAIGLVPSITLTYHKPSYREGSLVEPPMSYVISGWAVGRITMGELAWAQS